MRIHKQIFVVSFILLLGLLLAACAPGMPGTTASNLTVKDVLLKSAEAMQKLQTSHVDANANIQLSSTSPQTPSATNGTSTVTTPSNVSFTVTASGVQKLPQEMQLNMIVNALNQTTKINEVMTSDKVYIQNPQSNQWYVTDRQALEKAGSNYVSGVTIDTNSLLASLQTIKLTDHGDETVNGQSQRHITADIDKATFAKLVQDNPQLKSYFGQQDINTFLNNVKSFSSTVDVWIDEQNFYLHQTRLKLDTTGNTSTATQNPLSSLSIKLDSTVKLSQFNQPVTITPPAQAIPINNPASVFGNGTSAP